MSATAQAQASRTTLAFGLVFHPLFIGVPVMELQRVAEQLVEHGLLAELPMPRLPIPTAATADAARAAQILDDPQYLAAAMTILAVMSLAVSAQAHHRRGYQAAVELTQLGLFWSQ